MSRIVVFDSGVGGLSIYHAIQNLRPQLKVAFVSDNLAHPYGTKNDQELIDRVISVMQQVEQNLSPKLIVIACNTASTVALEQLRNSFETPFVGVVPAIKPAAQLSNSNVLAVLATPATVSREYTQGLIDQFAADKTVLKVGSSKLVEIAESKLQGETVDLESIEDELMPIIENQDCDTVVLACTHFPLLKIEMQQILKMHNRDVLFVDSGEAIARRVDQLLPNDSDTELVNASYFTQALDNQSPLCQALNQLGLPYRGLLTEAQ